MSVKNPVTIKTVAEYCQVSQMTVSRAFRENSLIRPETRAMILKNAEALGYVHSSRQGRPTGGGGDIKQIQLIFGNAGSSMYYFHMRLLTALEQQLAESGFECVIRTTNGNFNTFIRVLERVKNDSSGATIILGSFVDEQLECLLRARPGALLLDNYVRPGFEGTYSNFSFDNSRAAYLGTSHLAKLNRRRILLVCGPPAHFFSAALYAGYQTALADAELEFDPALVVNTDFTAGDAARVLRETLSAGIFFDAIFTNDEMVTGIYRVLQERGLRIPDDVAVCGCDDLPVGEQLYPELTTIMLDYNELAACAIRHIVSGKSTSVFLQTKLPPRLCVKKSTVVSA